MNFRIEDIEVSGETYAINIPEDEIYVAAVYDSAQASKTIYANLSDELKEKLSLFQLFLHLRTFAVFFNGFDRKLPLLNQFNSF